MSDYVVNGVIDKGGVQTDRRARRYSDNHGVSYEEGLRAVLREQHQYAEANGPWALPDAVNVPAGISTAYTTVSNVVANAGHDAEEAARQVNAVFGGDRSIISRAAQFAIERRKEQIIANLSPGKTDSNLASAYNSVRTELPATWAIYGAGANAVMTADAVREMFQVKYFSSRTVVKKYSSEAEPNHVRFDAGGREYRTYSFDR